jgi:hypothetical protein
MTPAQAKAFCENDPRALALATFNRAYPSISVETVEELMRRGLFHLVDDDHWRFGDDSNGSKRRLDGRKYVRGDNEGEDWHKLIGLSDVVEHDRKHVVFALEGSKDALAVAELAHRFDFLHQVGIVCALGSGYRPIQRELHQLRGRRVGLIGDNDAVGLKAVQIVSNALHRAGVDHGVWNWPGLEDAGKDLYEVVTGLDALAGPDKKVFPGPDFLSAFEKRISAPCTNTFFFSPSPQTLQPFNASTQEPTPDVISISVDELVAPYVMTKPGTGNEMSFKLARAIKPKELLMEQIDNIFRHWFTKSRPFLPKDADEMKSLKKFYGQMQRVRFLKGELDAACERARTLPPPFIPSLDGNEPAIKVATLCRELQRNAGNRAFLCPVNILVEFVPVRWPAQASWLLHVLERHGVIECVDRGAPNLSGKKGKSTVWRYKLPIDAPN